MSSQIAVAAAIAFTSMGGEVRCLELGVSTFWSFSERSTTTKTNTLASHCYLSYMSSDGNNLLANNMSSCICQRSPDTGHSNESDLVTPNLVMWDNKTAAWDWDNQWVPGSCGHKLTTEDRKNKFFHGVSDTAWDKLLTTFGSGIPCHCWLVEDTDLFRNNNGKHSFSPSKYANIGVYPTTGELKYFEQNRASGKENNSAFALTNSSAINLALNATGACGGFASSPNKGDPCTTEDLINEKLVATISSAPVKLLLETASTSAQGPSGKHGCLYNHATKDKYLWGSCSYGNLQN